MTSSGRHPTAFALRLYLLASAATAVAAVVVAVQPKPAVDAGRPPLATVPLISASGAPIRAEAQVFRTTPAMLAIEPGARRERAAHPRTLSTYRYLRAFPGAPPRIPHALRPEEFRTDACRTCHERGGYSLRFAAYVPVTPHPERGVCLQCHVGEDALMGIPVPGTDPNARCPQCHLAGGGAVRPEVSATWPTSVWPRVPPRTPDRGPPPIPHDLLFRENCVACHAGPAAVEEIRTAHPERANCRQCHVEIDPEAGSVPRGAGNVAVRAGGGR